MLVPVYDIKNCGPKHRFVANGKLVHNSDSINLQNLPSRGENAGKLKKAIVAPEGYSIIDADSAQIEARVLAWLAGQSDVVEAFATGKDVYKKMASSIYGVPEEEIDKAQRFLGKTVVLGCGYGLGAVKFQSGLKTFGVDIELEEARRIISVYRSTNRRVVTLWREAQDALVNMSRGDSSPIGRAGVLELVPTERAIKLPSGLLMRYDDLKFDSTEKGMEFHYQTRKGRTRIYGGKVIENCISGGTDVLTDRGWVPIENVATTDKVHDGVEFVFHGGVVFKSVQSCVTVDGVFMTPDHEVLTNDGWKAASQNPEPYRPDLRGVNCAEPRTQQRTEVELALPVSVREAMCESRGRHNQRNETWWDTQLRVHDQGVNFAGEYPPWYEQASSVCSMAFHARSLSATHTSGMEELRRAGGNCMRSMAEKVRDFLGRHGANICTWVGLEPRRQQWPIFAAELRMDYSPEEFYEQAQHGASSRCSRTEQSNRDRAYNNILPARPRLAGGATNTQAKSEKPVYDILNAGPRSRFVVRGSEGPFVVHNCSQGIARCIIAEQMLRIAKRYKVVLTVHDAIAVCVRDIEVEDAQKYVEECMRWVPAWADGLPLNYESGVGKSYGAC